MLRKCDFSVSKEVLGTHWRNEVNALPRNKLSIMTLQSTLLYCVFKQIFPAPTWNPVLFDTLNSTRSMRKWWHTRWYILSQTFSKVTTLTSYIYSISQSQIEIHCAVWMHMMSTLQYLKSNLNLASGRNFSSTPVPKSYQYYEENQK